MMVVVLLLLVGLWSGEVEVIVVVRRQQLRGW